MLARSIPDIQIIELTPKKWNPQEKRQYDEICGEREFETTGRLC